MSYAIDTSLLRAAGDILAAGNGRFTFDDCSRLGRHAAADGTMSLREMAAFLVVTLAVLDRCDGLARASLTATTEAIREHDAGLESWVVANVSRAVLQRGVALAAGSGTRKISNRQTKALIEAALEHGVSRDEQRALLVVFEWLRGHLTRDAAATVDRVTLAIVNGGTTLDAVTNAGAAAPTGGQAGGRQCGTCAGTGVVTCGSCGGRGYQSYQRSRQRSDGSWEYYQENVSCTCGAGQLRCARCGGTGRRQG